MELAEFQKLALRTESKIEGVNLNKDNLVALLKMTVAVTELLDGVKKALFYNKTVKINAEALIQLRTIARSVETLQWAMEGRINPSEALLTNQSEYLQNLDPRLFHGIIGIITESGELASALLKTVENPNHPIDSINIQEEMGDGAGGSNSWYAAIIHDTLGLDPVETMVKVINKLKLRFPDGYSDVRADERDLIAERKILES